MSIKSDQSKMGKFIWLGVFTITLLVASLGVWGSQTLLASAVIASGQVQVDMRRQDVQHRDGGTIKTILVRDGTPVQAGDPLIELDGLQLLSEMAILKDQRGELRVNLARLTAERDGETELRFPSEVLSDAGADQTLSVALKSQERLFEARQKTIKTQLSAIDEQMHQIGAENNGLSEQVFANEEQYLLSQEILTSTEKLYAKNLTTNSELANLRRDLAVLRGERGKLKAASARNLARIAELEVEKVKITAAQREQILSQIQENTTSLHEVTTRYETLKEQLKRLTLRAPTDGIVHELQFHSIGAVIGAGNPALSIIPSDSELEIVARVPPADIDLVHPGQDVNLNFSSLDMRWTPRIRGTVKVVSADATLDPMTGLFHYTIEISPDEEDLKSLGAQMILPGMPVDAYIQTGKRTPLSYMAKPLMDYFERALKER